VYNKLFTKILDSSIWLEKHTTRIVWITLLAAKDKDGYAHFSALENLAGRARVTLKEAETAVATLTSPDPNSSDQEFEGRRIERVPGGFIILNSQKYGRIRDYSMSREQTKERTRRWRDRKSGDASVTASHTVTTVCVSDSVSESVSEGGTGGNQKSGGRQPKDLEECLATAALVGLPEPDARQWYADCSACDWKRGDGTPFDHWPKQLTIHRDKIRANGHVQKSKINPVARKIALDGEILAHPCNTESLRHTTNPTPDQKNEYRRLLHERKELNKFLAG
jgi:hypothetical protein